METLLKTLLCMLPVSLWQPEAGPEASKGFVLLKLSPARALASSYISDLQVSILSLPISNF